MFLRSLLGLVAFGALAAQSQVLEFEVASVKPVSPTGGQAYLRNGPVGEMAALSGGPVNKDPGRISYSAINLRILLANAYGMRRHQILGPSWLDTEFYNIVAKAPPGTGKEQIGPMLQRLVNDRFRIESHRESRSMRVYTLTVAKGGHKLARADSGPTPAPTGAGQGAEQDSVMAAMNRILKMADANARRASAGAPSGPSFHLNMPGSTVGEFALRLSQYVNEPVIDKTEIEGKYIFDLTWTSDEQMVFTGGPMYWQAGPRLFSSMRDQLGLNLEPDKGPVEVLVIDKAEKTPTEN